MKKTPLYIFGKNPVSELFADHPELIRRMYVKETIDTRTFSHIQKQTLAHNINIAKVPEKKIIDLVGDVTHQGVVAEVQEFPYKNFYTWLENLDLETNPVVFLLDEITDPHNVGAILRSAAAFNVAGVLLPKNRQVGVNGTVYKASAGAAHKVPVMQIGNVNQTIQTLKNKGFWIAGLAGDGEKTLYNEGFDSPLVTIIGNEGKGIRTKTQEYCDYMIQIPISQNVESLNASVAAALVAYESQRQK